MYKILFLKASNFFLKLADRWTDKESDRQENPQTSPLAYQDLYFRRTESADNTLKPSQDHFESFALIPKKENSIISVIQQKTLLIYRILTFYQQSYCIIHFVIFSSAINERQLKFWWKTYMTFANLVYTLFCLTVGLFFGMTKAF